MIIKSLALFAAVTVAAARNECGRIFRESGRTTCEGNCCRKEKEDCGKLLACKSPDKSGNCPKGWFSDNSCVAGGTGVTAVTAEGKAIIKAVRDLKMLDTIKGLNFNRELEDCKVLFVNDWGEGPVYGNYTEHHYVLKTTSGLIAPHGKTQQLAHSDKYTVSTTCPLVLDESGMAFAPFDTDYYRYEEDTNALDWDKYIFIYSLMVGAFPDASQDLPHNTEGQATMNIAQILKSSGLRSWSKEGNRRALKTFRYLSESNRSFFDVTTQYFETAVGCFKRDAEACGSFEDIHYNVVTNLRMPDMVKEVLNTYPSTGKSLAKGTLSYDLFHYLV